MMDYLTRRDHTEKELRQKLSKTFLPDEVEKALQFARARKWLPSTDKELYEFSQKVGAALGRKNKGAHYINQYLTDIGLPPLNEDFSLELNKAQDLFERKFQKKWTALRSDLPLERNPDFFDELRHFKGQVFRFLQSRGFSIAVCQKILSEKLAN